MEPEAVVRTADLVLLTVPDDALAGLVSGLAAIGAWRRGQIAVHASGRYGVAVMSPAEEVGVACLAIHPALTFTGTSLDLIRMREAVFAITARPAHLPIAQALVVEFGGEAEVVEEANRPLYHAALVHGANHVVTAVSQAMQLLSYAGIENPGRLLGPLVEASIDGVISEVPGDLATLTGPVVRGDLGTITAHLAVLDAHPPIKVTYVALARATAGLARDAGRLSESAYAGVMDLLRDL
jgi:predicted short-subunit dehydrogenase-like oxidoreductase (DUF2520 family)